MKRLSLHGLFLFCLSGSLAFVFGDSKEDLLSHLKNNLMCVCPCTHRVGQCGDECGQAPQQFSELRQLVEAGGTEQEIYAIYEKKYGVSVLAAPKPEGFSLVAWVAPFVVLLFGTGIVVLAVRRLKPTVKSRPAKGGRRKNDEKYRKLLEKELEE